MISWNVDRHYNHHNWEMVVSQHLCILTVSAKCHPVIHSIASVSFVVIHMIMWFMEETSNGVNIGLDCFLVGHTCFLVWNLLTLFLAQLKRVFWTINTPVITLSNCKSIGCYKTKNTRALMCETTRYNKISLPLHMYQYWQVKYTFRTGKTSMSPHAFVSTRTRLPMSCSSELAIGTSYDNFALSHY